MDRFVFDDIRVPDAFRSQYFIVALENAILRAEEDLNEMSHFFSLCIKEILQKFSSELILELDQVILPTIVLEISGAKHSGELNGDTPSKRYESFFVDGEKYTERAKSILYKYPFLFKLCDRLIEQSFESVLCSIKRYAECHADLKKWLGIAEDSKLCQITPLKGADRHCNQQPLHFYFSCGAEVIYKPVSLHPDRLFAKFITTLSLENELTLKTLEVLPFTNYGWIKVIKSENCRSTREVENFYRRMGVLLAVADALNYTDGHCENLFAHRSFPILLDGETLFQNYEPQILKNKSILTTLMVQKVNSEEPDKIFISALQAPSQDGHETFQTHAIHDKTDKIEIRYQYFAPDLNRRHYPIFRNIPQEACKFVNFIIEGFQQGYKRIDKKVPLILGDSNWWDELEKIRARILLRSTMNYVYLIRKLQQPEYIQSEKKAQAFLSEKLGNTQFSQYERDDLLSLNIPYFYHAPGQKDLFDGKGRKYQNVFTEKGTEILRKQFEERSEEKMKFNCDILARHLAPS